jgi:hypothetical protein
MAVLGTVVPGTISLRDSCDMEPQGAFCRMCIPEGPQILLGLVEGRSARYERHHGGGHGAQKLDFNLFSEETKQYLEKIYENNN